MKFEVRLTVAASLQDCSRLVGREKQKLKCRINPSCADRRKSNVGNQNVAYCMERKCSLFHRIKIQTVFWSIPHLEPFSHAKQTVVAEVQGGEYSHLFSSLIEIRIWIIFHCHPNCDFSETSVFLSSNSATNSPNSRPHSTAVDRLHQLALISGKKQSDVYGEDTKFTVYYFRCSKLFNADPRFCLNNGHPDLYHFVDKDNKTIVIVFWWSFTTEKAAYFGCFLWLFFWLLILRWILFIGSPLWEPMKGETLISRLISSEDF